MVINHDRRKDRRKLEMEERIIELVRENENLIYEKEENKKFIVELSDLVRALQPKRPHGDDDSDDDDDDDEFLEEDLKAGVLTPEQAVHMTLRNSKSCIEYLEDERQSVAEKEKETNTLLGVTEKMGALIQSLNEDCIGFKKQVHSQEMIIRFLQEEQGVHLERIHRLENTIKELLKKVPPETIDESSKADPCILTPSSSTFFSFFFSSNNSTADTVEEETDDSTNFSDNDEDNTNRDGDNLQPEDEEEHSNSTEEEAAEKFYDSFDDQSPEKSSGDGDKVVDQTPPSTKEENRDTFLDNRNEETTNSACSSKEADDGGDDTVDTGSTRTASKTSVVRFRRWPFGRKTTT